MTGEILPIPEIPELLKKEFQNKNVAFFLGAGISRMYGCSGWNELARKIVNKCFDLGHINYRLREVILNYNDPKKMLTICKEILLNKGDEDYFFWEIRNSLIGNYDLIANYDIYNYFTQIDVLYLTSNIDNLFNKSFLPDKIVYRSNDMTSGNIIRKKLYKIHGSVCDRDSIIFTVKGYFERYRRLEFRSFLKEIFEEYTVVFIGYGMEEFEILDFVIMSLNEEDKRHYIIKPYFKGEEEIKIFDEMYFNNLGINVIGYIMDEKGYLNLYDVIKKWSNIVNTTLMMTHEEIISMERMVDDLKRRT